MLAFELVVQFIQRVAVLGMAAALPIFCSCRCCCKESPSITAVGLSPGNRCEPEGIPYYLPKPLLVVAKNVRHIDESKVGLTNPAPIPNAFDNQSSYADVKANITVPSANGSAAAANVPASALPTKFDASKPGLPDISEKMTPSARVEDGIAPDCFYTYQIIFVPDLSQKYGLRIRGGAGEIRAAMNLVNGWMYTGMGPYYIKDSSTAQNMISAGVGALYAGRGVADVLNEVGELASVSGAGRGGDSASRGGGTTDANKLIDQYNQLAKTLKTETLVEKTMLNYAEIHIYEPVLLPDGSSEWRPISAHNFDREYFSSTVNPAAMQLFGEIIETEQIKALNEKKSLELKSNKDRELPVQDPTSDGPGIPPHPNLEQFDPDEPNLRNQLIQDDYRRKMLGLDPAQLPLSSRSQNVNSRGLARDDLTGIPANQINVNVGSPYFRGSDSSATGSEVAKPCPLISGWLNRDDKPQVHTKVGSAFELQGESPIFTRPPFENSDVNEDVSF